MDTPSYRLAYDIMIAKPGQRITSERKAGEHLSGWVLADGGYKEVTVDNYVYWYSTVIFRVGAVHAQLFLFGLSSGQIETWSSARRTLTRSFRFNFSRWSLGI